MGFAWNLSKENFYSSNLIPYAKLRVTYGYNGNVDKSAAAVTTFNTGNGSFYYNQPYAFITSPVILICDGKRFALLTWL
jgi:hypothetical protein